MTECLKNDEKVELHRKIETDIAAYRSTIRSCCVFEIAIKVAVHAAICGGTPLQEALQDLSDEYSFQTGKKVRVTIINVADGATSQDPS